MMTSGTEPELQPTPGPGLIRITNDDVRNLNLSYNLLQDLSRYGFYGLETLETIDLSFNDVRYCIR